MFAHVQVNASARIEGLATGGQNLVSRDTYDRLAEGWDAEFNELGAFPLKGIAHEMSIIQVSMGGLSAREFPKLDRAKLLEIAAKSDSLCEDCNGPLSCLRCKKSRKRSDCSSASSTQSRPTQQHVTVQSQHNGGSYESHPPGPARATANLKRWTLPNAESASSINSLSLAEV